MKPILKVKVVEEPAPFTCSTSKLKGKVGYIHDYKAMNNGINAVLVMEDGSIQIIGIWYLKVLKEVNRMYIKREKPKKENEKNKKKTKDCDDQC